MEPRDLSGALILDKPVGLTSQDCVTRIKWALINQGHAVKGFKIGHGGTLDPFATGVLGILIGEATKLSDCYLHSKKTYTGTIHLGESTDSGDLTGNPLESSSVPDLSESEWQALAQEFVGQEYLQVPPMYSAKKQNGKALYELARAGIEVERKPILKKIEHFQIKLENKNTLSFEVRCESGTYVRVLAIDLAAKANTLAHLTSLRRTASSDLLLLKAQTLEASLAQLEQKLDPRDLPNFVPLSTLATHLPSLEITDETALSLKQGQKKELLPLLVQLKTQHAQAAYIIGRVRNSPVALFENLKNDQGFRLQRILN